MPRDDGRTTRAAVILAAGKGTRMRSRHPKVLHEVAGRPMLEWVIEAARRGGCEELLIVVGHGAEEVQQRIQGDDITWVTQEQQLGTGHALAQAAGHLEGSATVLVLSGDVPLVSADTLDRLARQAEGGSGEAEGNWGAMAVAELEQPGSLGRVLVDASDPSSLDRIVEAADASPEERAVKLINAGIYALPAPAIFEELDRLEPANAQGELYLTDALGAAVARGGKISLLTLGDISEAFGVNDRRDLARAHGALVRRHLETLMLAGVTILDPERTTVEPGVEVGADTVLHPGVHLAGATRIGEGCVVHQGVWMRDSVVRDDVVIEPYSIIDGAHLEPGSAAGPFARLRPGSHLETGSRVGNFVELKKTRLGAGAKASHLTYLGDAEVGAEANIGAGTITCNYDGTHKNATTIGPGAFIGSDTMLVAPVEVGAGASTGAGSTITQDVPEGALAVSRARQRNIPGWRERKKK